ncbi:MAG: hypothetical protein GX937_12310 [Lentisphaerae bacterium]|jgi:hypothetical protein|nr:hypothetical protein [Lentisphaerota bacterium]
MTQNQDTEEQEINRLLAEMTALSEDNHGPVCPRCGASVDQICLVPYGSRTGAAVGGALGAGVGLMARKSLSTVCGLIGNAIVPGVGLVAGKMTGMLLGFLTGTTVGQAVGSVVDHTVIRKYRCKRCQQTFDV